MFSPPRTDSTCACNKTRSSCPLCGRDNRTVHPISSPHPQWGLTLCQQCGLLYLRTVIDVSGLARSHRWSMSFHATADQRRALRWGKALVYWKKLRKLLLPHRKAEALIRKYVIEGRLLDVGCGSGRLLSRLDELLVPVGIEVDRHAAAAAAERAKPRGGCVLSTDALSGLRSLDDASFDGVLMSSFLEHENELLLALEEARRVLCPTGILIIKVPNYDCWNRRLQGWRWSGYRFPDHVNYFTPTTLRQLVLRAGLEVARFSWRDRLPTSDNMWLVAQRPGSQAIALHGRHNRKAHRRAS